MTDAGASALATLPLGVCLLFGARFRPPLSDQLVSQANPRCKMGKYAPRPLCGCAALLGSWPNGSSGLGHVFRIVPVSVKRGVVSEIAVLFGRRSKV